MKILFCFNFYASSKNALFNSRKSLNFYLKDSFQFKELIVQEIGLEPRDVTGAWKTTELSENQTERVRKAGENFINWFEEDKQGFEWSRIKSHLN